MAECNPCGSYLSIEDIINKSVKCSTDGKVSILGALLNPLPSPELFLPTGTIVTKDGNMIVMAGDSNFVLTVDGFQPLDLLMSGGFPAMSNEKFITK